MNRNILKYSDPRAARAGPCPASQEPAIDPHAKASRDFFFLSRSQTKKLQEEGQVAKTALDTAENEPPKVIFLYFDMASIFIHPRDLVFADPSRLAGQRRGADLDGQAEAGGRRLHRLRCGRPQIAPRDPGRAFRFADTAERRTPADRKFRTGGAKLCYTSA